MEQITITIQEKRPYTGEAGRPPEGDFYCDGNKYTCWDKIFFATFKVGDNVIIDYTEKINGTYINRNISKMSYAPVNGVSPGIIQDAIAAAATPQPAVISPRPEVVSPDMNVGSIIIAGTKYDIIMRVANE